MNTAYLRYVVDASVIIAYLFKEEKTIIAKVDQLIEKASKEDIEIYSTYLLPMEVGNIIKQKEINKFEGLKVFSKFFEFPLQYVNLDASYLRKCMELVYATNASFYDVSYHVLALVNKATFLTLDKKYFEKAKELGNIELL